MNTFQKKIICLTEVAGTIVLLGGAFFAGLAVAHASFVNTTHVLSVTGTVESLSSDTLVLTVSGTGSMMPVGINSDTVLLGETLTEGDTARVNARIKDSIATAVLIRKIDPNTTAPETNAEAVIQSATVLSKTENTLTVESNAAVVTLYVTDDTEFVGSHFSDIEPGDVVSLQGYDAGIGYVAHLVVKQQ